MKKYFYILFNIFLLGYTPSYVAAQTWKIMYNKADSLMQKRLFKESIPLYEQALPLAEKEYGKNHENYLLTRNGLARSITFVKKKEEIEPFLLENLALCKKYGEKTAIYAQALHNIGTFFLPITVGNQPKQAEFYLLQAIALRRILVGEQHLDYIASLNNLSTLYFAIDNYIAAEQLCKEILNVKKKTY